MEANYAIQAPAEVIAPDNNTTNRYLLFEFGQSPGNGVKNGNFRLQLTDPDDPLFLFDYELSPAEYPALKEQQELYCEFPAFSQIVCDLLTSVKTDNDYMCVVDEKNFSSPMLLVQQKTKHRTLTHLSLELIPATPDRLNRFLSSEVQRFKSSYLETQEQCNELHEKIDNILKERSDMSTSYQDELSRQENAFEAEKKQIISKYETQIKEINTKNADAAKAAAAASKKSESDLVAKFEDQIREIQAKLNETTEEKHKYYTLSERHSEKIGNLEAQVKDITETKERLHAENKRLNDELTETTSKLAAAQTEAAASKSRLDVLQQTFDHNNQIMSTNGSTIDTMRSDLANKEQEIKEMREHIAKLEQDARELEWTKSKSKMVIEKLIEENKTVKEHYKAAKAKINAQSEAIYSREVEKAATDERVVAQNKEIARLNETVQELTAKLSAAMKANEEKDQEIEKERSMISYLNQQVTKERMASMKSEEPEILPNLMPERGSGESIFEMANFF